MKNRKKKSYPYLSFLEKKSHLNRVDIHVIYVKKFLTKIDI